MTVEETQIALREAHRQSRPLRMAWTICVPKERRDDLIAAYEHPDESLFAPINDAKSKLLTRLRNGGLKALGQPDYLGRRYQIERVPDFLFHEYSLDWQNNTVGHGDQLYRDVRIDHRGENSERLVRATAAMAPDLTQVKLGRPSAMVGLLAVIAELQGNGGFDGVPKKQHWEVVADAAAKRDIPGLSNRPSRSTVMKAFAQRQSRKSV